MIFARSIFLYITLALIMCILGILYSRLKDLNKVQRALIISFICLPFALLFGVRWGVGVDYYTYLDIYQHFTVRNWEEGFKYIMDFCKQNGFHFSVFFSIVAFLEIYLVLLGVSKYKRIFPYIGITLIFGCYWLSLCNGLRQSLATSIIFLGFSYLDKKNWCKYLCFIFLATLFHNSAIICVTFLILIFIKKDYFTNSKRQVYLLIGCAIITHTLDPIVFIENQLESKFSLLSGIKLFEQYSNTYDITNLSTETSFGIGYVLRIFFDCFIIYYSTKIKSFYNSKYINILYILFYIGCCSHQIFINSQLLSRFTGYFISWNYVIGAFWLYGMKALKMKRSYRILIMLYALTFLGTMYKADFNTAQYYFYWDFDKPAMRL